MFRVKIGNFELENDSYKEDFKDIIFKVIESNKSQNNECCTNNEPKKTIKTNIKEVKGLDKRIPNVEFNKEDKFDAISNEITDEETNIDETLYTSFKCPDCGQEKIMMCEGNIIINLGSELATYANYNLKLSYDENMSRKDSSIGNNGLGIKSSADDTAYCVECKTENTTNKWIKS